MVISTVNQVVYNGDGVTTAWPYTFRIIDATDIKLAILEADGTETDVSSDYYVDTVNNTVYYPGYAPGAEPPAEDQPAPVQDGQRLLIYRQLPITQEKDLGEKWPFNVIELGLDKLTMILQQIYGWWDRCLKISPAAQAEHPDFDMTFPVEAGKSFRVNAEGTGFEVSADPQPYADMAMEAATTATEAAEAAEAAAAQLELQGIWNDTVADMVVSDIPAGIMAGTKGYYSVGDGGSGTYAIRTQTPSDVDDGGSIIFLNNGNVAELITKGTVNAKQFGAKGDNVTDDTEAFSNLESVVSGKFVNLCGGTYVVDETPKGNLYYNGSFSVDGETVAVQNCKINIKDGILTGYGITDQQYVFAGDIPPALWRNDDYKNSGLISFGTGNFRNINAKTASNIAIGNGVMSEGNPSNFNIGIGDFALHSVNGLLTASGDRNVAIGSLALLGLTTGRQNVAIGRDSGQCVTTGSSNVFVGYRALCGIGAEMNLDGNLYAGVPSAVEQTVAVGHYAGTQLSNNSQDNVIIGSYAGRNLVDASNTTIVGASAALYGQYGVSANGKQMVNGTFNGSYVQSGNTVTVTVSGHSASPGGYLLITFTSGGLKDVTAGIRAFLYVDTVVDANTFTIHSNTARDTSGNCVVYGFETGTSVTKNIAKATVVGNKAAFALRSIVDSVFVGNSACSGKNDDASASYASNFIGSDCGYNVKSSQQCDFYGQNAGYNVENPSYSVLIGRRAGYAATTVDSAVSIGRHSGLECPDISGSVFVGMSAGNRKGNTTNCVAIGSSSMFSTTDTSNLNNSTAIGYQATVTGSNQVQLGNTGTTTYVYGAVQDRSDARDKADVRDTVLGLDFINALRPVDFKWDYRDSYVDYEEYEDENGDINIRKVAHEKDGSRKRNRYHHGLIAQEVKAVLDAKGIDFGGYQDHSVNGGEDVLTLGYEEFLAPLIKSVQELNDRLEKVEGRIDNN